MLRKALTQKAIDRSTVNVFSFSFFCDLCGMEWKSQVKPFSGGECPIIENDEAKKLLWSAEHRAAFDEANLEAHFHFANCPKCGKWVCEDCYRIKNNEFGGACKECNGE